MRILLLIARTAALVFGVLLLTEGNPAVGGGLLGFYVGTNHEL